jgi:hypothetical protein
MQFHVANASSRVISERSATREIPSHATPSGHFDWDIDGTAHLAAFAPIEGAPEIAAPPWTLVVSQSRAAIVAPMDDFRSSFPLAIALALGAAIVLSVSQLRRLLVPLDALYSGTRRLAEDSSTSPWWSPARTSLPTWPRRSMRCPTGSGDNSRRWPPRPRSTAPFSPRRHSLDRANGARADARHLSL